VAGLFLAPVGVLAVGSGWAHLAPHISKFPSGSDVRAVSVVAAPSGYREIPTPPEVQSALTGRSSAPAGASGATIPNEFNAGSDATTMVYVQNQVSSTTWFDPETYGVLGTYIVLAANPALGTELFDQAMGGLPAGGTTFTDPSLPGSTGISLPVNLPSGPRLEGRLLADRDGSVVVFVLAESTDGQAARTDAEQRMVAQLRAVPASLAQRDFTGRYYEGRHNVVHRFWTRLAWIDVIGGGSVVLVLAVLTLLVSIGQKALRRNGGPKAGWYPDPTGQFHARVWTGRNWSDRVCVGGRLQRSSMPATVE
jgi:hypothetical protein